MARSASSGTPAPPAVGPFGFEVRPAWRRDDPAIEADAIAFWTRNGLLPATVSPERRAKELVAAAYQDGRLAAVSTATIERIEFLRANFAVIRGATDPEFRRSHAQLALGVPSRAALQSWAAAHREEGVAGVIAFVFQAEWGDFAKLPVWPESELELAAYAEDGRQVRVVWFDDFRYEGGDDDDGARFSAAPVTAPGLELRPAWRRDDPQIARDAIAFWAALGNLPPDVTPEARAKELVLAAYQDGRLVGVVTAALGVLEQVRARLAEVRGSVDPALRHGHVGFAMLLEAREILETWSAAHPHERLAGLCGIVESPDLRARQRQPYWPRSRFGVVGFTPRGHQIRVSWFRDFRLD